jgi:DNA-binding CsgD family transcriptional regulator
MNADGGASEALEKGRDAFARRRWKEAYTQLSTASELSALRAPDIELLAASAYLIGNDDLSDELWVRAHSEHLRDGSIGRAARCTFWLVLDLFTRGHIARATGWLARGRHLLEAEQVECPERGLLLVLAARLHLKDGDVTAADAAAREAVAIDARFDDPDLKVFCRLIVGQALAAQGQSSRAGTEFDEAMVAVTASDVSPIAVGIVYCAVIEACHRIFDIQRSREWTEALSRWCDSQPDLIPFRGVCLVHRVEIMRFAGAWSRAMEEAEQARAWLMETANPFDERSGRKELPPFKFPIGALLYELGELWRVRGDLAEADASYRQANQFGQIPEPGMALLHLAQGRTQVAAATIRRVLAEPHRRFARPSALVACVEIMIAAGDLIAARAAGVDLQSLAVEMGSLVLRGFAAHAMGAVLLAEGDAYSSLTSLREAWVIWQELDAPYHAARARVQLARACRALGDDNAAELELDAARRVFERLAAAPDLAVVNDLARKSTTTDSRPLTPRELQVIGLVATGRTNRAIAKHLSISERTVDRHVSNILTKLDLPSRSAATAYAYEHNLIT